MSNRVCIVDGCGRGGKLTRGMCSKDYRYWLDHTPPEDRPTAPRFARDFWQFVKKRHAGGCWTWIGPRDLQGYGRWGKVLAHRHSWGLANGPIPEGAWILHHCDNKPCVNPLHLYAGSRMENTQDAMDRGRIKPTRKRFCPKGHEKIGDNLTLAKSRGHTVYRCRICENDRSAERQRIARRAAGLVRPRVTVEGVAQIRSLRSSGMAQRTIAKTVGRSLQTVQRILKEA